MPDSQDVVLTSQAGVAALPDARLVGREFEDQAAAFLLSKGLTIIKRRYTCRGGEIDLVALQGEILVFIEVKGRNSSSFAPEGSVNDRKRERICKAARRYLAEFENSDRQVRFDIVAIDPA